MTKYVQYDIVRFLNVAASLLQAVKTGDAEAVRELLNFGLLNKDGQQACTGVRLFFFFFFF